MTLETLLDLGTTIANFALLGAIVFVVSYGVFFRWYATSAGRSVMAFASSIVVLSLLSFLFRGVQDTLVYGWARLSAMLFVGISVWGMVYVLWATRYQDSHPAVAPRTSGPLGFRSLNKEFHPVNNNDRIISYIRTATPAAVGALLAWLIAKIPAVADWLAVVDAQLAVFGGFGTTATGLLTAGAIAGVTFLYYAAARWLGEKFPWVEKWLLGRSAIPVYLSPDEAHTITDAVPVAENRLTSVTFGEDVVVSDSHEHTK